MIFKILEESAQTIKEVLLKKNTNDETMKEIASILERKGYMVNLLDNDFSNDLFLEFQKKDYGYRLQPSSKGFFLSIKNEHLYGKIKHEDMKTNENKLNQLGYKVSYQKNSCFGLDFKN